MSRMPVGQFLRSRFRSLGDGGYAGLVFLLARSADNPDLHERLFREWPDTHDVTRRYLGVITPAPSVIVIDDRHWRRAEFASAVDGVACLGEEKRLNTPGENAESTFRMDARPAEEHMTLMPVLTRPVREHQDALSAAATEMRKFFGVSEKLLPCAVIVSLQEKKAFALALNDVPSLYVLLKQIKIGLEPVTTEIDKRDAELARAKEARLALRSDGALGNLRGRADSLGANWDWHVTRLASELVSIAGERYDEDASLCRWMARRLGQNTSLTDEEQKSARTLVRLLSEAGIHGRVPRRLRRTLAKLNAGYPNSDSVVVRLAALIEEERAIESRIGQLKAKIDELGQHLSLGAAIVDAAREFDLTPVSPQDMLAWRELAWPIEVLSRPKRAPSSSHSNPTSSSVENTVAHAAARSIIQAGTIHGGVHIYEQAGGSPPALSETTGPPNSKATRGNIPLPSDATPEPEPAPEPPPKPTSDGLQEPAS
ncbi:hypothetical protein LEL86_22335 [Streptomyces sp. WA6-1-16]|uniref:hypothetical protein n=1 Tax=Streptomyces sp. WA6-1-16 TaxID=2879427 RepID=UPI001CE2F601|nr:hypothetical protein [Streptomyces sp. WA6-1-16]UCA51852.1 hypothetical protein LEL86_22335 [Streptomyces sp. WA6-1-16]